jgi:oligoribonuclease
VADRLEVPVQVLDPERHVIVEIATLVTDDELAIVATGPDLVIHASPEEMAAMDDFVRDMHTKSGLLPEIEQSTVTLEDAATQTLEFVKSHVPDARTVPLCGNSIGTDRRFLAKYMPELEDHLHYRSVDVSTIKELARRWYPGVLRGRPDKEGRHRALDDIVESVEELRYYREAVFKPRAEPDAPSTAPAGG